MCTIRTTLKGKPEVWLSKIKEHLGDQEILEKFCIAFGRLFHTNNRLFNIPNKVVTVLVEEKTNTAKVEPSEQISFKDNRLFTGKDGEFIFEQLVNKLLLLNDEFDQEKRNRGSLLRLIKQKTFLLNKKVKKNEEETVLKAPLVFVANPDRSRSLLEDESFLNRMTVLLFQNKIDEGKIDENLLDEIEKELPKILVYCNKMFIKEHLKTKYQTLKNSRMTDKKFENLIKILWKVNR